MNFPVKVVRLTTLQKAAARRQPGYLQECLARGRLDTGAGLVTFTPGDHADIRRKYRLGAPPVTLIKTCLDC